MRDFDDGVNALVRLVGALYGGDVPYGKLHSDCHDAFREMWQRIMDKYAAAEKKADSVMSKRQEYKDV